MQRRGGKAEKGSLARGGIAVQGGGCPAEPVAGDQKMNGTV